VLEHVLTYPQDWLYDEGEDTTKAAYVAKMDEIRFVAGPIIQRYQDKLEEERQAVLKAQEEAAAKKRAEAEAKKKAEEEAKKSTEPQKSEDTEMTDADGEVVKPDGVEEPAK
jgi:heat shock protein 4